MSSLPEPPVFPTPVSAELANALAQAVRGFLQPGEMYFVASLLPGDDGMYEFWGPYPGWNAVPPSEQQAIEAEIAGWFGPFTNVPGELGAPDPQPNQQTIYEVQVTPQTPTGTLESTFLLYPIRLTGAAPPPGPATPPFDAVFLSAPAVQKFVVPYYAGLYGAEFAETLTNAFDGADLALMVHLPWSEYEMLQDTGVDNPPPNPTAWHVHERFTVYHRDPETGEYKEHHIDTPRRVLP
ncbi:MAG TPA: hypothetical protein VEW03_12285 [Longimicrobiaceae bacterium]|nr:hypothetical protein [Longimicrobiaceae bacterium]